MSAQVSYLAGSSLLVVAGDGIVLLDSSVPDTVLRQVHSDLDSGGSMPAVLNRLTTAGFATFIRTAVTADFHGWTVWSLVAMSVHVDGSAIATPDSLPLHIDVHTLGFADPPAIQILKLATPREPTTAASERPRWLPLTSGIVWCGALRIGLSSAGPTAEAAPRAGATTTGLIGSATLPVFRGRLLPPPARPLETSGRLDKGNPPGAGIAAAEGASVLGTNSTEARPDDATIVRCERAESRSAPSVRALICRSDHPNPPESHACRVCGQPLTNTRVTRIPRPAIGVLRLVAGTTEAPDSIVIDGNLVLGSDPTVPASADLPRHIRVGSARSGISARHLHIGLEGWHVLVSDLGSSTGTTIEIPGTEPTLLATRHPTLITPDTLIVLAKSLSYRFQVSQ